MDAVPAVALGVAAAVATSVLTGPVLRALPEPSAPDGSPIPDKVPYADLVSPLFVSVLASLCGLLVAGAALLLPAAAAPQWLVLGTVGLLLAGIDARTTWLPLPLTRVAWALGVLALIAGSVIAGPTEAVLLIIRTGVGAAGAGLLFWVIWRLSRGGLGFGDVRYAPLVGAAAGAVDWPVIWLTLVIGAVIQGLWGVGRLVRRQREPFPYAPSIFAGAWLALTWWALAQAASISTM